MEKIELSEGQHRHFIEEGIIEFEWALPEKLKTIISNEPHKRDLFRKSKELLQFLSHKNFGRFVSQLIKVRPYRLVMDASILSSEELDISKLSFQGAALGIIFSLEKDTVTFFEPDITPPIKPSDFLVVIGENNTLYVPHEEDANRNYLKKLGYAVGDKLKNEDFPIIYK